MAPVPNLLPAGVTGRRSAAAYDDDDEPEDEDEQLTLDDIAPLRVDRARLRARLEDPAFDRSRLAWPPPDRITRRPEREYATFDDLAPLRVDRARFGGPGFDWSPWYLTWEEDVGTGRPQQRIIRELLPAVRVLAAERIQGIARPTLAPPGERAAPRDWSQAEVDGDAFFAWNPDEVELQVSPDVYVLDDPPPLSGRYETWRPGHHAPSFVLEVVSRDWRKDYEYNIDRYSMLGAREYIIADPDAFLGKTSHPERRPLVRYVDSGAGLERRYAGAGPVYSAELDIWFLFTATPEGEARVRISRDEAGRDIVPTEAEARRAEAERADAEAKRANTEAERADTEAKRADAEAKRADDLAAELDRLRARLAKP